MTTNNLFGWLLAMSLAGTCGCAQMGRSGAEGAEARETKVRLDQTPPAVRQTIERELAGAQLEDIAMEQRDGKTVYETDLIRGGHKWEVVVGEDGKPYVPRKSSGIVEEPETFLSPFAKFVQPPKVGSSAGPVTGGPASAFRLKSFPSPTSLTPRC